MYDNSQTGLSLTLVASATFPNGFQVTAFSDDADPFDVPAVNIAEAAMNVNGDLVTWSSPQPIPMTINVIAGSEDDINLAILFNANRVASGKKTARDIISVTASYPDGSTTTLSEGKMLSGMPVKSSNNAGKGKSKTYTFTFQNLSSSAATA